MGLLLVGILKLLNSSMDLILLFRKLCYAELLNFEFFQSKKCEKKEGTVDSATRQSFESQKYDKKEEIVNPVTRKGLEINKKNRKRKLEKWNCIDRCCWVIGYLCTTRLQLLLLYHCLPTTLPGFQVPESVGARLKRQGLTAQHPVVLVPGIMTGGLELWEGKPCADGLFRQRLWGGTFTAMFKKLPLCWLDHLSLNNETGLDPLGIRVRAVQGLVAADNFIWAILIENLAKIGYDGKNLYMAAYDWRLSFQNTQIRDHALSRLKSEIELMYRTNGYKKVVVVPHSTGVVYFLHFLKWVEAPPPMGGGGGPSWCNKYIKSIMNISPTFLGDPKTISNLLSAEGEDINAFIRAIFPGILDSELLWFRTPEHVLRVTRTWDSAMSLMPKGGETIWGNLDWSPEELQVRDLSKKRYLKSSVNDNISDLKRGFQVKESIKHGNITSFSKAASAWPSSLLSSFDSKEFRAEAHFSHGIADDLDGPKYEHYKYWSNPLETRLPNAPEMEIYCLYGVGIPTKRSYTFKLSATDRCKSIPFWIDTSVDGEDDSCLKNGAHFVDGDEIVRVISAGYMCAKGWRGRTRFNPSGSPTYAREYRHKPPASLHDGRGRESASHADIMESAALIEDVLRIAAGATGPEIGGDQIHSDILRISEKIKIQL